VCVCVCVCVQESTAGKMKWCGRRLKDHCWSSAHVRVYVHGYVFFWMCMYVCVCACVCMVCACVRARKPRPTGRPRGLRTGPTRVCVCCIVMHDRMHFVYIHVCGMQERVCVYAYACSTTKVTSRRPTSATALKVYLGSFHPPTLRSFSLSIA